MGKENDENFLLVWWVCSSSA